MSTFSTKGGLYERAQKRFAVADGKRLFTYSFYEKRKLETLVCCLHSLKATMSTWHHTHTLVQVQAHLQYQQMSYIKLVWQSLCSHLTSHLPEDRCCYPVEHRLPEVQSYKMKTLAGRYLFDMVPNLLHKHQQSYACFPG